MQSIDPDISEKKDRRITTWGGESEEKIMRKKPRSSSLNKKKLL